MQAGAAAWLFLRHGKIFPAREGSDQQRGIGLAERVRRCLGPHMHENPVCRRVWREMEPLLDRYGDDDAGFERAIVNVLDASNETARLSVEDRKAAMRILLAT